MNLQRSMHGEQQKRLLRRVEGNYGGWGNSSLFWSITSALSQLKGCRLSGKCSESFPTDKEHCAFLYINQKPACSWALVSRMSRRNGWPFQYLLANENLLVQPVWLCCKFRAKTCPQIRLASSSVFLLQSVFDLSLVLSSCVFDWGWSWSCFVGPVPLMRSHVTSRKGRYE